MLESILDSARCCARMLKCHAAIEKRDEVGPFTIASTCPLSREISGCHNELSRQGQGLAALRDFDSAEVRSGSKPAYMRFSIWVRFAIRTGQPNYLDHGYALSDLLSLGNDR